MSKILVVAGEASGDMHAAKVIRRMKELNPELEFFGMGGQQMAEAGVDILYDPTDLSVIGFWESIKHLGLMYKVLNKLETAAQEREPDAAFLVDFSGFNMKMAKRTAKLDIPTVNYFAPSAWVWGKWRAKRMAKYGAKIASVFPMERDVYQEVGADVEFVGHPLVDMVETELSPPEFRDEFDIADEKITIGLLPGSRKQEIDSLLAPMLEAAELIRKKYPQAQFLLPVAETIAQSAIAERVKNYEVDVKLIAAHSYEVMDTADLLLSTSGTATLEAAFFQTPMVIIYKTSWLSYGLSKLLVRIPHVGLPNIIAEEEIVPELLQSEANGQTIAEEALTILDSPSRQREIAEKLEIVRDKLGSGGAVNRVANLVLQTGGIQSEIS
ncbi:lipid-A-disaccharide synthase [Halanaerobacter jeridensis]|uniref:Lipid-A-disaccharide synthase n=1 Tax=Halanaerobacter jeridensis TaxID=706427 RepID=A0A938XVA6_9FIRM|nr:lipid-A-disaccharide synthase [Halanaerobacter jeridensis]MBM7556976.1 lipid-A-disaccharide synthase [Halanaerobacter jeridensis]